MQGIVQDLRRAVRLLTRTPAFATACLLVLALGIGMNAAVFSVVDAVLLRPLPYPDADRLVRLDDVFTRLPLRMTDTGLELTHPVEAPELGRGRSFTSIGAYTRSGVNLGGAHPERLRATAVAPGFFTALGVMPPLGRTFADGSVATTARVAVIGHRLWLRAFGADPHVVGISMTLNGQAFDIIGVMPADVDFPDGTDVWIPRAADPQVAAVAGAPAFLARLAPNVTVADARAEALRLIHDRPLTRQDEQSSKLSVMPLRQAIAGDTRPILLLLTAAAVLVLIVSCLNAAGLFLVRARARGRELAVRRALGASTGHILRQSLCESLAITAVAGLVAIPIARWTLDAIGTVAPAALGLPSDVGVDIRSLTALAAISLLAAVAAGFAPSLAVPAAGLTILRSGVSTARGRTWPLLRSALVVAQISGAVALLAGATAIVRTLVDLATVDLGARHDSALVMEVSLPRATYPSPERIRWFHAGLREALRALPGVTDVGATSHLPGSRSAHSLSLPMTVEGLAWPGGQEVPNALRLSATPGYFAALGIDILAGRAFTDDDRQGSTPVAIVSERFASVFGLRPAEIVGRRVNVGPGAAHWAEVVGVARDVRMRGPEQAASAATYVPFSQTSVGGTAYIVADAGAHPEALVASVRRAALHIDPALPLYNLRTFAGLQADYSAGRRLAVTLMTAFGAVAVVLAVVGLYGVLASVVRLRTRDIGIRIAVGAAPAAVRRQVLASGVRHAAAGITIGVAAARALWTLVSTRVPGIGLPTATDTAVLSAAVLLVAMAACWLPARRASRVDPVVALRQD